MSNNMNIVKSELIQDLLFKYVQNLGLKYDEYFRIYDSNMISDDEMYIFIDVFDVYNYCGCVYECDCANDVEKYKIYLNDFKRECDRFIKRLSNELPKHLDFTECYHEKTDMDLGDGTYYESCELHFKIIND